MSEPRIEKAKLLNWIRYRRRDSLAAMRNLVGDDGQVIALLEELFDHMEADINEW